MKTCTKCKTEKDESEFYSSKSAADGHCSQCKSCMLEHMAIYHKSKPEKSRESSKRYRQKNPTKARASCQCYKNKNKESVREYGALWRKQNKSITAAYYRKRRKDDALFNIKGRVSRRINGVLREAFGVRKSRVTNKILGCTGTEFLAHLGISSIEELEGNHVDHVCPLSCALTEEEVYKLNHYSNLRIIPAHENLSKSDSWTPAGAMLHLILLGREWPEPPTTEKA